MKGDELQPPANGADGWRCTAANPLISTSSWSRKGTSATSSIEKTKKGGAVYVVRVRTCHDITSDFHYMICSAFGLRSPEMARSRRDVVYRMAVPGVGT